MSKYIVQISLISLGISLLIYFVNTVYFIQKIIIKARHSSAHQPSAIPMLGFVSGFLGVLLFPKFSATQKFIIIICLFCIELIFAGNWPIVLWREFILKPRR